MEKSRNYLYSAIIVCCLALITAANIVFSLSPLDWWQVVLFCALFCLAFAAENLIVGLFIRKALPEKIFERGTKLVIAYGFEKKLYKTLGVKKWKDSVPEMGFLSGFSKRKITNYRDNGYIARFIMECNAGVVVHRAAIIFGFLFLLIRPETFISITLPLAFLNAALNLMVIMVLKFNLPKLEKVFSLNETH